MIGTCFECGEERWIHQHHIFGRQNDPETVVALCPDCHFRHHYYNWVVYKNEASTKWAEWCKKEQAQRYVTWQEKRDKLTELGYVPMWDGWEQDPDLASDLIWKFPKEAEIYLTTRGISIVWPDANIGISEV